MKRLTAYVSTKRFKDDDPNTICKYYIVRQNQDMSVDSHVVETNLNHDNPEEELSEHIKTYDKKYKNSKRWYQDFYGDMEESDKNFSYCEIEISTYSNEERSDLEFKIDLKNTNYYGKFSEIKRYFDLYFDPQKKITSLKHKDGSRIDFSINDEKLINSKKVEDFERYNKKLEEKIEKLESTISSRMSDIDNMSSVSRRKKKRGFLGKIRKIVG